MICGTLRRAAARRSLSLCRSLSAIDLVLLSLASMLIVELSLLSPKLHSGPLTLAAKRLVQRGSAAPSSIINIVNSRGDRGPATILRPCRRLRSRRRAPSRHWNRDGIIGCGKCRGREGSGGGHGPCPVECWWWKVGFGRYGSRWKCTEVYGSVREFTGVYGSIWECMGVYGSVWECMANTLATASFSDFLTFGKSENSAKIGERVICMLNDSASILPPTRRLPDIQNVGHFFNCVLCDGQQYHLKE